MSRCTEMSGTWSEVPYIGFTVEIYIIVLLLGVTLNRGTRAHLIVACEDHTCRTYPIEKHMYFIHMDQNPMDFNPNSTTSCRDELAKTVRIVINPFLGPKMGSTLELSTRDVMFGSHRDSI